MLEVRNVSASYGEVKALRNLTLDVAAGETMALVGRNGAGKTTTLRVIAGVIHPLVGDVRWDGQSIVGLPPEERVRRGIALVPEGRGVFPGMTVEENLRMGAFWRRPGRRELNRALDDVYGLMPRLGERRRQPAGSLSGGEQQMLAIGRALLSEPKLLLLDEPSLGLSPAMIQTLYELLGQLKERGVSFILVEQFVPLALKICDRAVGLSKGEVALSGRADDVAHDELTEIYMGGPSLEAEARSIIGVE
jgi:branched-chain amino acid transport system ATP-binding protein